MKKNITVDFDRTEWLYAPGFVYYQYEDTSRELGLIFPWRREWPEDERYPLVLFMPGAAWHRQELYNDVPKFSRLAERGVVFAIVQVRESDTHTFPAQLEDVHRAVRWLIDHAEQFHIDTSRIFLAGGSSGGHLALMTGFTKSCGKFVPNDIPDYSIAGIIAQAPACDIVMCHRDPWPDPSTPRPTFFLMGTRDDDEFFRIADKAVCKTYVSHDIPLPPVQLFHYNHDPVLRCQMSLDLHDALAETGHEVEYYEADGFEHGGNGMWSDTILELMWGFIRQH